MSEFEQANLISWERHLARRGKLQDLFDPALKSMDQDQALLCIAVAFLYLQQSPVKRPSIKEVVGMLLGDFEPPHLPVEFSPSPPSNLFKSRKKAREASSSAGEESSSHSRDSHEKLNINRTRLPKLSIEIPETATFAVKLRIKSFRVPELTIEIPEIATVAFLKRTVAEAVTTMLEGGLQVGIVLQGEQVRDENETLLLTGILHDDKQDSLGFTLQPKPYPSPPLMCDEDPSFLVHCSTPQPLTRYLTTPLDQGPSDALLNPPTLGIGHAFSSFIWLCGPITGLVVQPCVGIWSDKCYSKYVRRRPFIGSLMISVAVTIIGFSADIGYYLGDAKENCSTYRGTRTRAAVVFIIGFWLLDLANNTVQGPARALLADLSGDTLFMACIQLEISLGFRLVLMEIDTEIKKATGGFSSIIATHSDGSVYKAEFRGGLVAVVKEVRIFNEAKDAFNKEVQLLMRLHHQLL
ncbi:hypothetical protein GIB67_030807 [Kingdonia uniflora]|uniref:Telomere repeat-binding protein 1-6-like ubiquitin-like domain-containing protein n=1 Tax=Kingdonia uniflora TaxID=39325 RepID=A0A7J7L374_9MAGN|nr:hypothetical protein GIB67_030807 [Kingdonia uniflora]